MRIRGTHVVAAVLALGILAVGCTVSSALDLEDVVRLHQAGLEEKTILSVIEASGDVFELEADDLIRLKEAGVGESILRAMIETKPSGDAASHKAEVRDDGSILLTNRGVVKKYNHRGEEDRTNVISSRPPVQEMVPTFVQVVLPEAAVVPASAPATESQDRGPYGIGHRWHPSWNDHSFTMPRLGYQQSGWPIGAQVSSGWNAIGGYYFLPAAVGPEGPSSFGQFGFHLLPQADVVYRQRGLPPGQFSWGHVRVQTWP